MLKRLSLQFIRSINLLPGSTPGRTNKKFAYRQFCCDQSINTSKLPMELKDVCKGLRRLANPTLAGSWDNVGLLVEPTAPHTVSSVLLTNDLTEAVMEEAVNKNVQLIMSYHPPIFSPLKRLTQASWKERIIIKCLEQRIAVFSPHTAFDAVPGGVNDWLLQPFEGVVTSLETKRDIAYATGGAYRLEFTAPSEVISQVRSLNGATLMYSSSVDNGERVSFNCSERALSQAINVINGNTSVKETVEIFKGEKPPLPNTGAGRICKLKASITTQEAINLVKKHLDLKHVRLALAVGTTSESEIKSIAVCAGSGASVLRGVDANLYITGEMSHHEVLDANHRGASVILCDHSNTERGYLSTVKKNLQQQLGDGVKIFISETDKDPLDIV